jgi:hypothetical protein
MEVCQNATLFPFRDHGTEQDAGYEEDKTEGRINKRHRI